VAISALFFLAFAYFAVGQAAVSRNTTQTAADAAALAAARESRDQLGTDVLAALKSGDIEAVKAVLQRAGTDIDAACGKAYAYAADNGAKVLDCGPGDGPLPGVTVSVKSLSSVGKSVVKGSDGIYAQAQATAVVEPRCDVGGIDGVVVELACDKGDMTEDPTTPGFKLDLSALYTVHLSK
jgi:hypothetical protein